MKISCWENCTSGDTVFTMAEFLNHLNVNHGQQSMNDLPDHQQTVCTCCACESVVMYNEEHKKQHSCESSQPAQFFLFLENNRDKFGISNFNAPMLKSQGVSASMQFMIEYRDPELDTILWQTTNGNFFFYHYCSYCNFFLADTKSEVASHLKSDLHNNYKEGGWTVNTYPNQMHAICNVEIFNIYTNNLFVKLQPIGVMIITRKKSSL